MNKSTLSEAARSRGRRVGGVYWDLSEYYEHVPRGKLYHRCRDKHIPERIIIVALRMYQVDRLVTWRDLCVPVDRAQSGVL
eukprot:8204917-Lingulodinium_polyedra.AAC.1